MKLFIVFFALITFGGSSFGAPHVHEAHLPLGGRSGLHGMVLYGNNGNYLIDHIPMEHAPHDFQVIYQAQLFDLAGKAIQNDFSNEAYTLKPASSFSLNDLIAGRLKTFQAEIFKGGFEQQGEKLAGFGLIQVQLQTLKLVRHLPAESSTDELEITLGNEVFRVHLMTPGKNYQSVINQKTGQELWCVKGPDFFEPCH